MRSYTNVCLYYRSGDTGSSSKRGILAIGVRRLATPDSRAFLHHQYLGKPRFHLLSSYLFRTGRAGEGQAGCGLSGDRGDGVEVFVDVQDGQPGELRGGRDDEVGN